MILMKYSAVVLAAGKGERTGLKMNKILYEILGKKVIDYSLDFFLNDQDCLQIILVINPDDFLALEHYQNHKKISIISGGKFRQESVYKSLQFLQQDYVIIHDGARPFISVDCFTDLKGKMFENSSVTLGVPITDTIQRVEGGYAKEILDRTALVSVQTPQGFHRDKLKEAHKLANKNGFIGTDDTSLLLEFLRIPAFVVAGDKRNIKFTTRDDIPYLEVILK